MMTGCELGLKSCDLTSLCPIKGYYRGIPVTFRHSWDRILCEAATQHRAPKSFGAQDENGDQQTAAFYPPISQPTFRALNNLCSISFFLYSFKCFVKIGFIYHFISRNTFSCLYILYTCVLPRCFLKK